MQAKARTGLVVNHTAEMRDGHCPDCHEVLDKPVPEKMPARYCWWCQDWKVGRLIVREVTIEPPKPPTCNKLLCLLRYVKAVVVYSLVSTYEARRTAYAMQNRHKNIPERFRTGEPMPRTFFQALIANMKLTCPVCKRFNWTPFLSRKKADAA